MHSHAASITRLDPRRKQPSVAQPYHFTATPPAFTWLDDLARRAARVLQRAGSSDLVGHADWTCGNLRFDNGRVSASYDWDSLAAAPEPVLVGLAAASFTQGSTTGATTPTTAEVTGFLQDHEQARSHSLSDTEQRTAAAAVTLKSRYTQAQGDAEQAADGAQRPLADRGGAHQLPGRRSPARGGRRAL